MRPPDGPEPGPPTLRFFGGPRDGETMWATTAIPAIALGATACANGFYVWREQSRRYEWRDVPPAPLRYDD